MKMCCNRLQLTSTTTAARQQRGHNNNNNRTAATETVTQTQWEKNLRYRRKTNNILLIGHTTARSYSLQREQKEYQEEREMICNTNNCSKCLSSNLINDMYSRVSYACEYVCSF